MKRALIITLAFWIGIANFAYASAQIECGDRMQFQEVKSSHACCRTVPCECAVEGRTNNQTAPFQAMTQRPALDPPSSPLAVVEIVLPTVRRFDRRVEPSPHQAPLYTLFSVYRI